MSCPVNSPKRFYIHTLGCKVNQYESQAMREILIREGFKECLSKEIADIYIINTCTVTHHADKESRYLVGMFHRANPKARIVVVGCYVEKNRGELESMSEVDRIFSNNDKVFLAERLLRNLKKGSANSPSPLSSPPARGR